jgi:hypothetical protein
VSEDLTARVAELAATIEAKLAEDEAAAKRNTGGGLGDDGKFGPSYPDYQTYSSADTEAADAYIERFRPLRALRRVKAVRDLVTAILAEQHDYNALDGYYSCSQAREGTGLVSGPTGPPGSGCSDPERAGKPCDCGRDARVARLLAIIASEWEGDGHD